MFWGDQFWGWLFGQRQGRLEGKSIIVRERGGRRQLPNNKLISISIYIYIYIYIFIYVHRNSADGIVRVMLEISLVDKISGSSSSSY